MTEELDIDLFRDAVNVNGMAALYGLEIKPGEDVDDLRLRVLQKMAEKPETLGQQINRVWQRYVGRKYTPELRAEMTERIKDLLSPWGIERYDIKVTQGEHGEMMFEVQERSCVPQRPRKFSEICVDGVSRSRLMREVNRILSKEEKRRPCLRSLFCQIIKMWRGV